MMRKIMLLTIAVMAFTIISCGGKTDEVTTNGQTPDDSIDIRIGVMPGMDCLPLFVAQERGLFEKQGLKIKFKPFTAQMDIDTALVGGSIDFAVTDKYRVEQLTKQGVQLQVWGPAETNWKLVANKKSRLTSIDQFGGKLVAITRYSATANMSEALFKDLVDNPPYYIQINDVVVRTKMMINGELDAAWLQEPQVSLLLAKGCNIVNADHGLGELGEFVYRTKSRYNTGKGDKLRRAYNSACDSINKNGVKAYSLELKKYCGADTLAFRKLASYKFKKQ